MKRPKQSWEVIIGKLCEAEVLLAQGKSDSQSTEQTTARSTEQTYDR